jgi:HlyD family secretion protein
MTKKQFANQFNWFKNLQNLIEQRVNQNTQSTEALVQSRYWVRTITWSLIGTTGFAIAWLVFAKTEEIVVAPGKLVPIGVVKDVRLPVGGVVSQIFVKDGQQVRQGQVLLRLDTDTTRDRKSSIEKTIVFKQLQLNGKHKELQKYTQLNATQIAVLKRNLALEKLIASALQDLARQGAAGKLQYLQQQDKVQQVEGQLQETRVDGVRQVSILTQATQQLESELAELKSKLVEINVNIRYQEIKSPVSGTVFDLKPTGRGFVAQTSEPVLKIVPYGQLEAKVEVPSDQVGFISVGKAVDISINSFNASDFGVLKGVVSTISSDALPPDERKQDYYFPTKIKLDSQTLILQSGQKLPLQAGMSLTANIKLRKVSYLQLLLSDFKDKAKSLQAN